MISVSNTFGAIDYSKPILKVFLKIEQGGKAKILTYYYWQDRKLPVSNYSLAGMIIKEAGYDKVVNSACLIKKRTLPMMQFGEVKFKETGAYYFKDCPELVDKIKKKEYTLNDLNKIASI